jgi:DNA repair protein RadD
MRLFEGKTNCLLLDFGGNVERHGPIDSDDYGVKKKEKGDGTGEAPRKTCPSCGLILPAGVRECGCGFLFPEPKSKVESKADGENEVMGATASWIKMEVNEVFYSLHDKPGKTPSMKVTYRCKDGDGVIGPTYQAWWCVEHTGFARSKALDEWTRHSNSPCPDTAYEAVTLADEGALAVPENIMVKQDGKYWRVKTPKRMEKPERVYLEEYSDEDLPF